MTRFVRNGEYEKPTHVAGLWIFNSSEGEHPIPYSPDIYSI